MRHFNNLTSAQAERLALLLEEMGEAQQAIGKILRHGYESTHPNRPSGPTNRQSLERELGDVETAVNLLKDSMDVDSGAIYERVMEKTFVTQSYLHHQKTQET